MRESRKKKEEQECPFSVCFLAEAERGFKKKQIWPFPRTTLILDEEKEEKLLDLVGGEKLLDGLRTATLLISDLYYYKNNRVF